MEHRFQRPLPSVNSKLRPNIQVDISENFEVAKRADDAGSITFYAVTVISAVLLFWPEPRVQDVLHPLLMVGAVVAVLCTIVTTIYQTRGNRLLREAQLADSLGAAVGGKLPSGYYNSPIPASVMRLASTTLENTLFTGETLSRMLVKERFKNAAFFCILLLLLTFRRTSTDWLLLLGQTFFSADLVLSWMRMERFHIRTDRVHEKLRQFFLQDGDVRKPNGMAIVIAAFTDYECAKDEAAMPLDDSEFKKLNPVLSQRWEEMKQQLKIN